MMPKNLWISNILVGVEPLSNPINGFGQYSRGRLCPYYDNFIDYIGISLYEDAFLEDFINHYARKLNFYELTIDKLRELHLLVDPFYKREFWIRSYF